MKKLIILALLTVIPSALQAENVADEPSLGTKREEAGIQFDGNLKEEAGPAIGTAPKGATSKRDNPGNAKAVKKESGKTTDLPAADAAAPSFAGGSHQMGYPTKTTLKSARVVQPPLPESGGENKQGSGALPIAYAVGTVGLLALAGGVYFGLRKAHSVSSVFTPNQSTAYCSLNHPTGRCSLNQPTGDCTINQPTGDCSINQPTGNCTINHPTGRCSINQPTGNRILNQPPSTVV